jgi:hypothetical protein
MPTQSHGGVPGASATAGVPKPAPGVRHLLARTTHTALAALIDDRVRLTARIAGPMGARPRVGGHGKTTCARPVRHRTHDCCSVRCGPDSGSLRRTRCRRRCRRQLTDRRWRCRRQRCPGCMGGEQPVGLRRCHCSRRTSGPHRLAEADIDPAGLWVVSNAEPCSMCASALVKAKVSGVVFGAPAEPSMDPWLPIGVVAAASAHSLVVVGPVNAGWYAQQVARGRKIAAQVRLVARPTAR